MIRINKGRSLRGVTAFELLIAFSILSMVLAAGVGVMSTTVRSWARNTERLDTENDTATAVRYMASKLQEAYTASVSSDGTRVTYRLPQKDAYGEYITPPVPETFARQFYVSQGTLYEDDGSIVTPLLTDLTDLDPSIPSTDKHYAFFSPGGGQIVRVVTVHLVTSVATADPEVIVRSRHRQSVLLRNVPTITR
jgi:type II secretory pathway pseudopilin PulG